MPWRERDRFAVEQDCSARTVYRSKEQALGGIAFGCLVLAIEVGNAFQLSTTRAVIQVGGSVAIAGTLTFVFVHTRLCATGQGITIRNPLSTTTLPWDQIKGFRIGRHSFMRAVCIVDLVDGSSTYAFAIQIPNRSLNRPDVKERKMIEELNQQLRGNGRQAEPPRADGSTGTTDTSTASVGGSCAC